MFNLKAISLLIAMGVLSVTAAPASGVSSETELVARQSTAFVFACHNARWGTPCQTFGSAPGSCCKSSISLTTEAQVNKSYDHVGNVPDSYNDRISSIRNLDKRRFHCVWYEHDGWRGRSYSNQEDANLHDGDSFFSDRISSWRCNTRQGRVAVAGVDDVEGGEQQ